jgi:hypothetical protein
MSLRHHWSHSVSTFAVQQLILSDICQPLSMDQHSILSEALKPLEKINITEDQVSRPKAISSAPRIIIQVDGAGSTYALNQYAHTIQHEDTLFPTPTSRLIHQIRKADQHPAWLLDFTHTKEFISPESYWPLRTTTSQILESPESPESDVGLTKVRILLIDDFDRAHRNCLMQLSYIMLYDPLPIVLIVSAGMQSMMQVLAKTCRQHHQYTHIQDTLPALKTDKHLDIDSMAPIIQTALHNPNISIADRWRILASSQTSRAPSHIPNLGEIDLLCALLGPQVPLKVLAVINDQSPIELTHLLSTINFQKVGECKIGGDLYALNSAHHWIHHIHHASQQAHRLTYPLLQAVTQVYPIDELWRVSSLLKRLHSFQGQSLMLASTVSQVEPLAFWKASRALIQSLTHQEIPLLVLQVISGLGYEWAQKGIAWGRWRESEYVLQNSILATQRMKDLKGAARLLISLGQLYLQDRKDQSALETLESSLSLLTHLHKKIDSNQSVTQNSISLIKLIMQNFLLYAQACQQSGQIQHTWKVLQQATYYARQYQADTHLPMIALKKSQLALALNQSDLLFESWQEILVDTLPTHLQQEVYLLLAQAYIFTANHSAAQDLVQKCNSSSLKAALMAYLHWHTQNINPMSTLQETSVQSQSLHDMESWQKIQHLRAFVVLEMVHTKRVNHLSSSDLQTAISQAKNGIERGIQVATHLRDRLSLILYYFDLAQILHIVADDLGSFTAFSMAKAWSESLDQSYHFEWQIVNLLEKSIEVEKQDQIKTQVGESVTQQMELWQKYSLSVQSQQANNAQANNAQ